MVIVKNISTSRIIFANNVDLWRDVCYTLTIIYLNYFII
jgi:hypothetical protein